MGDKEVIKIPEIILEWSDWYSWDEIKKDARKGGIRIPNKKPELLLQFTSGIDTATDLYWASGRLEQ